MKKAILALFVILITSGSAIAQQQQQPQVGIPAAQFIPIHGHSNALDGGILKAADSVLVAPVYNNTPATTQAIAPFAPAWETTTFNNWYVVSRSGQLKNLFVHAGSTVTGGIVTVYVNGVATSLSVTIGTTTQNYTDTVHLVNVSAGDRIYFKIDNAPGSTVIYGVSVTLGSN